MKHPQPRVKRTVQFHFRATEEEAQMIRDRMTSLGISGMGPYFRKMAIDGMIVNIDLSDIRELTSLLRYTSNNMNQYAKRANEIGSIYAADIEDLRVRLDELRDAAGEILQKLADMK